MQILSGLLNALAMPQVVLSRGLCVRCLCSRASTDTHLNAIVTYLLSLLLAACCVCTCIRLYNSTNTNM